MGPETHCLGENGGIDEVNCCFGPRGACCKDGTCSYPIFEQNCLTSGGVWYEVDSCLDVTNDNYPACVPSGACCVGQTCSIQTQNQCSLQDGVYLGDNVACQEGICNEPEIIYGCCCNCNGESVTNTEYDCNQCGGIWHEGFQCKVLACGGVCPEGETCCPEGELWSCGATAPIVTPYDAECKTTVSPEENTYDFDDCTPGFCCFMCQNSQTECTSLPSSQAECLLGALQDGYTLVETGEGTGNWIAFGPSGCEIKWVPEIYCGNGTECCLTWAWSPQEYCTRCKSDYPTCCTAQVSAFEPCDLPNMEDICLCTNETTPDDPQCPDTGGGVGEWDPGWPIQTGEDENYPWSDLPVWSCGKCCEEDSSVDIDEECGQIKCTFPGDESQCNGVWQEDTTLEGTCCQFDDGSSGECIDNCQDINCCPEVYGHSCGACCFTENDERVCELKTKLGCDQIQDSIFYKGRRCHEELCLIEPVCDPPCEDGLVCCPAGGGNQGYCAPPPCIDMGGGCGPIGNPNNEPCVPPQVCCYDFDAADGSGICSEQPCPGPTTDPPTSPPPSGEVCPKEICTLCWQACKGPGKETRNCCKCLELDKGLCDDLDGMRTNSNCDSIDESDLSDPCISGGVFTASSTPCCDGTPEQCAEWGYASNILSCSDARTSCNNNNPAGGTNFQCGWFGDGTVIGGIPDPTWIFINSGCCSGTNPNECGTCDFGRTCVDCDGVNDEYNNIPGHPHYCGTRCSKVNPLTSLGDCTPDISRNNECMSSDCLDCDVTIGPVCRGECPTPSIGQSYCCYECECTDAELRDGKCCRCGKATWNDVLQEWECLDVCPDGGLNVKSPNNSKPSECYCSACACEGHCNSRLDDTGCGCPFTPLMGGETLSHVRLPDGECIWLMCEQPDCPYPECS